MLAYAMSFGLEIAMNAWLPGYFTRGFHEAILALGFNSVAGLQIAAGTFAAVESFTASLFRPFAGFMSDLFQRKAWTPLPFVAKTLPYAPRLRGARRLFDPDYPGNGRPECQRPLRLASSFGRGTGGSGDLHILRYRRYFCSLLFPDRPGVAAGFIGGVSTAAAIAYPLVFSNSANLHIGYAHVALYLFLPFVLFYFWAARYERHPEEHGLLSEPIREIEEA